MPGRRRILWQFTKYFIGGVLAVGVHMAVLVALVELFAAPAMVATSTGFVAGLMVNYVLQHVWVFQADGSHQLFFLRYLCVTMVTFGLNLVLFWTAHHVMGLWYPAAQILATGVVFLVNFVINRLYTFQLEAS